MRNTERAQLLRIRRCEELSNEFEDLTAEWDRVWWYRWFRSFQLLRAMKENLDLRRELLDIVFLGPGHFENDIFDWRAAHSDRRVSEG